MVKGDIILKPENKNGTCSDLFSGELDMVG
jgi:hypothetical protein